MKKTLVFWFILMFSTVIFSETVVLRDGSRIKGDVLTISSQIVSVKSIVGQIVSYVDYVSEIYFDDSATPVSGVWIEPNEGEWINVPGVLSKFDGRSGTILFSSNGTFVFSEKAAVKYANYESPEFEISSSTHTSVLPGNVTKLEIKLKNNNIFHATFSSRLGDVITFVVKRGIISIPTQFIETIIYPVNSKYNVVFNMKDGAKIYGKILKYESGNFLIETAVGVMFLPVKEIDFVKF
ncbi:hypothetical protein JYK00_06995 [Thermosipho ferrireducens]|uniref:DUF5666 domain-containing protein n=1 Tax=Thermosipho ferrireducens TaxID=2571116 RepID=A0ABX7S4T2_9BACT|nr:hypothetical protein [Thermosipho ferrireducens]QTA37477.1 hypothetical protein JYK00_06995 [Thermosipho ferrireducens]